MGIILSKMNWDISSIFTGNSVLNQAFSTGTTEGTFDCSSVIEHGEFPSHSMDDFHVM